MGLAAYSHTWIFHLLFVKICKDDLFEEEMVEQNMQVSKNTFLSIWKVVSYGSIIEECCLSNVILPQKKYRCQGENEIEFIKSFKKKIERKGKWHGYKLYMVGKILTGPQHNEAMTFYFLFFLILLHFDYLSLL